MHPLSAKVTFQGWTEPTLLKVASLSDFATYTISVERTLLDLRGEAGRRFEALQALPWGGFLVNSPDQALLGRPWLSIPSESEKVSSGDVIEILPTQAKIGIRYRRGGNGNVLFATERCNSFCLMCSQPPREVQDDWRVSQLCELIELIDKNENSLAISGGEPTLLGDGLLRVVAKCKDVLPQTHLHVLSNGRRFSEDGFAERFTGAHPSVSWGIPLYGDHFALHDYVVQRAGAFSETMRGLYALKAAKQRIEIRVVLVKPVVERLEALARYLYRNLPFVEHIAFMGVEPTGFAKAHYHALWMDPADMAGPLAEAVEYLAMRGLNVSLYNLPLCALPRSLWRFAKRSISDWKQHYLPACEPCGAREQCGGLFAWVTPGWTSRAIQTMAGNGETSCAKH